MKDYKFTYNTPPFGTERELLVQLFVDDVYVGRAYIIPPSDGQSPSSIEYVSFFSHIFIDDEIIRLESALELEQYQLPLPEFKARFEETFTELINPHIWETIKNQHAIQRSAPFMGDENTLSMERHEILEGLSPILFELQQKCPPGTTGFKGTQMLEDFVSELLVIPDPDRFVYFTFIWDSNTEAEARRKGKPLPKRKRIDPETLKKNGLKGISTREGLIRDSDGCEYPSQDCAWVYVEEC